MLHSEDYINNHSRENVIGWNDDDGIWSFNWIKISFFNIICKCIPEQHTKSKRNQYLGSKSRWPQGTKNQPPRFCLQVNHVSVLFCCEEKLLWWRLRAESYTFHQRNFSLQQKKTNTENYNWLKYRKEEIVGCPGPAKTSTTQQGDCRVGGSGTLLRACVSWKCKWSFTHDISTILLSKQCLSKDNTSRHANRERGNIKGPDL